MRQQPLNAVNNPFLAGNRNKRTVTKKKVNPMGQSRVIDYLEPKALQRFINDQGKILPRRITGVTAIQQRQIALKSFLIGYFIFTLFCLQYLNLELSILSVLIFCINFIVMNTLDFKTYRLQIILKNNTVIEKRIPKKLKYEFITIINDVRNQLHSRSEIIL